MIELRWKLTWAGNGLLTSDMKIMPGDFPSNQYPMLQYRYGKQTIDCGVRAYPVGTLPMTEVWSEWIDVPLPPKEPK